MAILPNGKLILARKGFVLFLCGNATPADASVSHILCKSVESLTAKGRRRAAAVRNALPQRDFSGRGRDMLGNTSGRLCLHYGNDSGRFAAVTSYAAR